MGNGGVVKMCTGMCVVCKWQVGNKRCVQAGKVWGGGVALAGNVKGRCEVSGGGR